MSIAKFGMGILFHPLNDRHTFRKNRIAAFDATSVTYEKVIEFLGKYKQDLRK